MIRAERHERILSELARRGAVGVQELAALLDASIATIRRDIRDLHEAEAVVRTHGGAQLPKRNEERPFDSKVMTFLAEKRRIGAEAGQRLVPGSVVGCGGGTTVMQMIPAIRHKPLKLVTIAVNIALELRLAEDVEVTLTGGLLRRRTAEMVGHIAERTLADVHLDVAIVGVDGLSAEAGLTTFDASEAYANRVLLGRAREVWILADHSKLGRVRPAIIAPAAAATRLITDTGAEEAQLAALREAGLEVIAV